jgi:methylthioribose-1-phosphate isomerase
MSVAGVPHPDPISGASYSAVELSPENDAVILMDQRRLPLEETYIELREPEQLGEAISEMIVRGAPAIGIAAAYAMVLAARTAGPSLYDDLERMGRRLKLSRPTAVNLAWAIDRCLEAAQQLEGRDATSRVEGLAQVARDIHREDVESNRAMAALGAERVPDGAIILTHCNAGALATGGYGTALGVVRAAHEGGKKVKVLADETRPYLQGSRLTAWELARDGIAVELIADATAGTFFQRGIIDLVLVGSDRIAANGDVANKIGTYTVACLARAHERPFYVAAPWSTVDERCPSGDVIPIEQRSPRELTHFGERQIVPMGVLVHNPAFDVTPAKLVSAIFTERGVIDPVGAARISELSTKTGRQAEGRG